MDNGSHLALARKYRPKSFNDLKGQESLARTLSNAIKNNKIHHAYLLTGIRGIGKTTTARIIARNVNCSNIKIEGFVSACNECNNCLSVNNENHIDILEIDAASNTSVDGVREIITNAKYKPVEGKYKIFIIDEVHMLSKSAFNALLKILEEPPIHVIFIFATTEINKIPVTIISRCQRFDLKPFKREELVNLLSEICNKEKIEFDIDAIELIALKGSGSARDSLSLLDQAIALASSEKISIDIVSQMIGRVDVEDTYNIAAAIINNNTKDAINILNDIYSSGKSLDGLFQELMDMLCYILKLKTIDQYEDIRFKEYKEKIHKLEEISSISSLTILWQLLSKSLLEFRTSHSIIHSAEMAIIKAIYATTLPTIDAIVQEYSKQPQEVLAKENSPS